MHYQYQQVFDICPSNGGHSSNWVHIENIAKEIIIIEKQTLSELSTISVAEYESKPTLFQ